MSARTAEKAAVDAMSAASGTPAQCAKQIVKALRGEGWIRDDNEEPALRVSVAALRLSLAQAQAREAKMRSWLTAISNDDRGGRGEVTYDEFSYKRREAELQDAARKALSTPTDTAALRAMLEKAAGMGMSCGYSRCCSKLEAKSDADRNEIVDRVLGGS